MPPAQGGGMEIYMMQSLGLFSQSAVEQMTVGNEYIEYLEGCLLDNFIF